MNIVLDVGNTNIYVGVFQKDTLLCTFRTATDLTKSSDEYAMVFRNFLEAKRLSKDDMEGILLSSVVPPVNRALKAAIREVFGKPPLVLEMGVKTGLPIKIENPAETGSDLIADCVGGIAKYGNSLLIVDLGTANKIIVVDKKGAFVGGVITAGMKISMQALAGKAINLNETTLECPPKVIGRNTDDCINSGLIYGTKAMIKELCHQMEEELGYPCKRILTGGYAALMKDLPNFISDPTLILEGLNIILNKNNK